MFDSVFLFLISLFFPIACYYLYLVYSKSRLEKEKNIFLDLSLFTSFYFIIKFSSLSYDLKFLINIPLLIAVYYKRKLSSVFLSFLLIIYLYKSFNINIEFLLIYYMVIIIFLFIENKYFIKIVSFLTLLIEFLLLKSFSITIFIKLILNLFLIFLIYYFVIILLKKIDDVINMFYSLKEISKDMKLYESLFKITHEIKNPLAVCKGYLDMFDYSDKTKIRKYVNIINEEINRTLVLLKDFSDISKIKIEKSNIDLNLLLEDVCEEVSIAFDSNIEFTWCVPNEELIINGDYDRLKQVLINIIKNSKESIKNNGKVILIGSLKGKKYNICIKDTGEGMDDDSLKSIGTAFYTTKKNGTGLGVCLSKEIIERHGGVIKYESKKNKGTIVNINLPIKNFYC